MDLESDDNSYSLDYVKISKKNLYDYISVNLDIGERQDKKLSIEGIVIEVTKFKTKIKSMMNSNVLGTSISFKNESIRSFEKLDFSNLLFCKEISNDIVFKAIEKGLNERKNSRKV